MRILYIEDDPNNRNLVRRVLMVEGFDIELAENAPEGIAKAVANPPDLILMDVSMPGMDGLTATRKIRTMPEIAHLKIVALTANAMQGDREMTLEAGCNGYISKPINIDTFVDEIRQFI